MVSPGTLSLLTALDDGSPAELEPTVDPDTGTVGYPDAERLLNATDDPPFELLESLAERGVLEKSFEEKVYICPDCDAEGLQYTTACPDCGSAYTVETDLFEHLDCGCVEPRTTFEAGDGYVCPNCEEHLDSLARIEQGRLHTCQDCGEWAESPAHRLACRACGELHAPLEAIERALCRYALTDTGGQWLRTQLTARDALVAALDDRDLSVSVDRALTDDAGTAHHVHVYGEDPLFDNQTVGAIHERPTVENVATLREAADAAGARAVLVTTTGSVGERAAAVAESADITVLRADSAGDLHREYEVTEDPRSGMGIVQRITSAVSQKS
jgi:DNA-directed RNA polymerase subunit RPC12/RpoP